MVFDTGQVLQGLLSAYEETGDVTYLEASMAAGTWIAQTQKEDGSWTSYTYNDLGGVYHTYVAWPLARLSQVSGDQRFGEVARRNLDWALSNQTASGWFRNNAFYCTYHRYRIADDIETSRGDFPLDFSMA